VKPRFFKSGRAFRAWLATHHDRAPELLVGLYKLNAKTKGLTYPEALDEALAYGWIDGVRRSFDAERWTIRFTPRRARSIWSNVNIRHAKRLIADGRMTPAGMRAFEAREARRSGVYTYETAPAVFDRATAKTLAANTAAKGFFDTQPPGYRRLATNWIMSAKKDETRQGRLAILINKSARGERIDFLKPRS
jgi:uncharacterized protein YdeI (YjbR/CyaY-like superfamily)